MKHSERRSLKKSGINFGPDFIRWVEIFYKHVQSYVINNGFASDLFALERGRMLNTNEYSFVPFLANVLHLLT